MINLDLENVREKFNFSEEDIQRVPQNLFTYLGETFKDTAFRTSQYKMLYLLEMCQVTYKNTYNTL